LAQRDAIGTFPSARAKWRLNAALIVQFEVKDADRWAQYVAGVGRTLAAFGGRVLLRASAEPLAGVKPRLRGIAVVEFHSREDILRWHESPAYQALVPLRELAADVVLLACGADG
jgi:uncharacterized protein (DUF1330 family)